MNTATRTQCTVPGCERPANAPCFGGKPYCREHYDAVLNGELLAWFRKWRKGTEPPDRFKYLLGRASKEQDWETGESYLSAARIRDRAYSFEKTPAGCVFRITRHPGAFGDYYTGRRVVQTWEADLSAKNLRLLDERPWQEGEPDP